MSRTHKICVPSVILFGTLLVAGCSQFDPYERSYTWKPSRVNEANIVTQLADPADITRGRGEPGAGVRTATGAVERMWQGPRPAAAAGANAQAGAAGGPGGPGGSQQAPR